MSECTFAKSLTVSISLGMSFLFLATWSPLPYTHPIYASKIWEPFVKISHKWCRCSKHIHFRTLYLFAPRIYFFWATNAHLAQMQIIFRPVEITNCFEVKHSLPSQLHWKLFSLFMNCVTEISFKAIKRMISTSFSLEDQIVDSPRSVSHMLKYDLVLCPMRHCLQ